MAADSPLPDPSTVRLYVERLTEPYTGMPLLGVGGLGPPGPAAFRVEVRYDGKPASAATPAVIGPPNEPPRLHFSTQLPLEPADRVQVVAVAGDTELTLADIPLSQVGERQPAATGAGGGGLSGLWRRTVASVASGEAVSLWRWRARLGRAAGLALKARQKVRHERLARRFRPRDPHLTYADHTALTARRRADLEADLARLRYRPTISVLVPVYNVDPRWLAEAVDSVRGQVYGRWELCLADDASTRPDTVRFLDRLPADPRVKLVRRQTNGHICAATNAAADLATGDFVALLDNDDRLAPDALAEVVRALNAEPDADVVYSDEDKLDAAGRRYDPQFKPDWSPELLLSYNYINHLVCVRRSVFEAAGRFRPGYEGSQDHDLLLRVADRTDRFVHVPKILYHWRAVPTSTAAAAGVKRYVHTAGRKAVGDALARRGVDVSLYVPPFADRLGLPVIGLDGPDDGPSVAVVVRGDAAAAGQTVRAIRQNTAYRNYSIYLCVDAAAPAEAMNRMAAGRAEDLLLFLDAGVEPADRRWLSRLVAHLKLPGVGAAGGLVRDGGGNVVSAGTVLGMRDGVGPDDACPGLPKDAVSYYFYAEVGRTAAAPARGCLLTPRAAFERNGGFDADRFGHSLYDVDYCLRLAGLGLRSAHVGGAELTMPGGSATGRADDPLELRAFKLAHGRPRDRFYNPNLSDSASYRPLCDGPASVPAGRPRPVRALVAAHNLNSPEGAPRYLSEIVVGLARRGRLAAAVVSPAGGAGEAAYRQSDIPVTLTGGAWAPRFVDGRWTPAEYEAAQRWYLRHLRRTRPDVVVANTLLTFPVVEAAARAGVPAVWLIHESYPAGVRERVFPPFARGRLEAAFAAAARVVPSSHATAALFADLDVRGNVRVAHNGLDPAPFDGYLRRVSKADAAARVPGDPAKKRVVAVGTVCERKGQHTLVEAAAELARTRDDFEVHLVGVRAGVPYADYVRELVRRHGLERVVHLIAETDDVWRFYRAADVFVCTSHVEAFSRAVLEALAFGLPVVSTRCCGLGEQVAWGLNALPFGFGDAAGLAAQLGAVLADDRRRADMGRRARAGFDALLSFDEALDRYEAVIAAAAAGGPAPGDARPPRLPVPRLSLPRLR